ncbi:MAG: LysR family transcriptional regulator [Bradyrhizobium sp.]|nr:LysR family transcriptional regulator [Pseudomonadota bacterium]MDE2067227.1 LysR family transcriptional regulator [Bradyrhizobium sp.]MDE2471907.1 LysR family transcriptional regulator [Bradyrhizobium sp.]
MLPFDEEQQSFNRSPLDEETLLSGQFWAELRVFLAVAKTKSFNRAAEMTNTSQPTVSRQVRRLQDVVGSQLFISTPRGVKLTQKGEALARALSRLDYTLHSITSDLKAEGREEGIVRVSITSGLNALFAAPALLPFSAQYPGIQLHLKSPLNLINLRENQTDMMIGFGPSVSPDIQFRKLGQLHFIPVVAKDYIRNRGLPTVNNLEQHLFIQSEYYLARTGLWDSWQQTASRGRIAHHCDDSFAYGMLVKAGHGIGLLGSYTLVEPCFVPLEIGLRISVPLFLLALTERLNARPVRLVFDWLANIFGGDNPWFGDDFKLNNARSRPNPGEIVLRHYHREASNLRVTLPAASLISTSERRPSSMKTAERLLKLSASSWIVLTF